MKKIIFTACFLLLFSSVFALGSDVLSATPGVKYFDFSPNQPISSGILIQNHLGRELSVNITLNNGKGIESAPGVFEDLHKYFTVSQGEIVLAPKEKRRIPYEIMLPGFLEKGLHRAKIVVNPSVNEQVKFAFVLQVFVVSEEESRQIIMPVQEPSLGARQSEKAEISFPTDYALIFFAVTVLFFLARRYY